VTSRCSSSAWAPALLNVAGIWTYGDSGMLKEANGSGIHGLDERLSVKSLYKGQRFLDERTRAVAK
jgi:hypothetical protein